MIPLKWMLIGGAILAAAVAIGVWLMHRRASLKAAAAQSEQQRRSQLEYEAWIGRQAGRQPSATGGARDDGPQPHEPGTDGQQGGGGEPEDEERTQIDGHEYGAGDEPDAGGLGPTAGGPHLGRLPFPAVSQRPGVFKSDKHGEPSAGGEPSHIPESRDIRGDVQIPGLPINAPYNGGLQSDAATRSRGGMPGGGGGAMRGGGGGPGANDGGAYSELSKSFAAD